MLLRIEMAGVKRMGPGSFQWCPAWERAQTGTPSEHGKELLYFKHERAEHWNKLPREPLVSPSREILKTHLDAFLFHLI